ncbi:MAG: hypothetical protein ACOCP4_05835 [Candidatus Woesearchaeota archaeon]
MKQAILNLDTNFFTNPSYHGNGMVIKDFNQAGNLKRKKWLEVDDLLEKLPFKKKRGDVIKKATSLLYEIQDYNLRELDFIHIGMHNHVYSYESWGEFNYKNKPQQYNNYNAFLYLFKVLGLQKMIWVYPDYYTNEELMKHFENTYFELHQKNFKLKFEALEANVYSTRFKDFDFSEYDNILYFTITKNEPHLLTDEELTKLKTKIG